MIYSWAFVYMLLMRVSYSSVWSLQVLNATGTQEFSNHYYNLKTGGINIKKESIMIHNLSYKIEF